MNRKRLGWLAAAVALAVLVAYQVTAASGQRAAWFVAQADIPTVAPGIDVLAGVAEAPVRIRGNDYRRAAFGDSWTDDNNAPGGHNGCDTRNDVLDRDLVDKTYVSIKRCPTAVASGTLHDPYTNATIAQSLDRFRPVLERANADGVRVRGYVSTVLGCPYQGEIPLADAVRVAATPPRMG